MFNKQQQLAIDTLEGRVRIIAGAGSGKTKTLTHRYAKLIENGVKPANILCVTFTNKAAKEMRTRIESLVGELPYAKICTFHSFCLKLLRESIDSLGYTKDFNIIDSDDQIRIIKGIYKDCGIDYDVVSYKQAFEYISRTKINFEDCLVDLIKGTELIKNKYESAKEDWKESNHNFSLDQKRILQDCIYYGYLLQQQKLQSLDFNDLIIFAVMLLKNDNEVLTRWQNRLEYIMVDEFQDASTRQFELVELLSEKHGNLFVVGDPDQTIYTWRGAKPELLLGFDERSNAQTIILNQNYRSTPNILNAANAVIKKNRMRVDKDLFTLNNEGEKLLHYSAQNAYKEGEWIVKQIKSLLHDYKPKDIAILYRMNFLSRHVEEALIRSNIPYKILSGINFYERKEIKDILAYLHIIQNSNNDLAFERIINVPARGIGEKKVEAIKKYADENGCSLWKAFETVYNDWKGKARTQAEKLILDIYDLRNTANKNELPLAEFVVKVIKMVGYYEMLKLDMDTERQDNLNELINAIRENFSKSNLTEYLQEVTLLTSEDMEQKSDSVTLMTIHSAKGLEFPVVFVCGMSEGYLPSNRAETAEQEEEERRLAYVAYTRAKNKLIVTDSTNNGERETSRFITELSDNLIKHHEEKEYIPVGFKRWVI